MASPFSIDAVNDLANKTGSAVVPVVSVNTTPTQPTPVAAPGAAVQPVVSGQPEKPTADVPEGAAPVAAGMAPGQTVPTVAQARAGVPVAVVQPMPPQQQGATPAQPTLAQRAGDIITRVGQGFSTLLGTSQPVPALPTGIDRNFSGVITPAAQAAIAADTARRAATAPNIFNVRKQSAVARNY